MATSGSWDYSLTAAGIIADAYENLGVVIPGGTISSARSTKAMTTLNLLVKQYQGTSDGAPGVKVHTRQRITLMLAKGQQTYLVGPAATDARSSTLLGRTTVSTAYVSGTSLIVAANTDTTTYPGTTISMTSADFIGVVLSDGTIGWTTLNGTPGGTTLTLTAGFSLGAAVGNYVYWFTKRAQRFPVIESAVLRQPGLTDSTLGIYTEARQYDQGVGDKYADGSPTAILVEPLRLNTRVTCNSQPTDVTQQIILTVLYPSEDYDATTDDVAYPQEALRFLSWELAFSLSPIYRWTPQMDALRKEARAMYLNLNPENSAMFFAPGGL